MVRRLREVGQSAFLDCFNRAVVGTSAAADTDISIDDVLLVAFGNSLNGAVVGAGAALHASIGDFVSHDFPSNYVFSVGPQGPRYYSSMDF